MAPPHPEHGFESYRERLRAGGRGAFQRAFDVGLLPKNMKEAPNSSMPYAAVGDSQQMWSGAGQMQSNDFCGMSMQQQQYQCIQQVVPPSPEMQHMTALPVQSPMQQPQMSVMMPQMAMQQQVVSLAQGEQSPQMAQMQMTQMPVAQMQLPQMSTASGEQTPTSNGASTPTEIEDWCRRECMGILTSQTSQFFPCDQDLLAAQLKASADCQRYED